MKIRQSDIRIGRVLHEDNDFVTIEVAKNDKVTFHLQQNEDGETVGGDEFFSFVYVRRSSTRNGMMEVWDPFED